MESSNFTPERELWSFNQISTFYRWAVFSIFKYLLPPPILLLALVSIKGLINDVEETHIYLLFWRNMLLLL